MPIDRGRLGEPWEQWAKRRGLDKQSMEERYSWDAIAKRRGLHLKSWEEFGEELLERQMARRRTLPVPKYKDADHF